MTGSRGTGAGRQSARPRPLRVKCCPALLPSALSNFIVSRRKFTSGGEQTPPWHLSVGIGRAGGGGPAPGLSLGCLPLPREGAPWDAGENSPPLSSLPALPQGSPWSHLLAGPQLDPNLGQLGVSGWGWEGGKEGGWGLGMGSRSYSRKESRGGLGEAGPCRVARDTSPWQAYSHPVTLVC